MRRWGVWGGAIMVSVIDSGGYFVGESDVCVYYLQPIFCWSKMHWLPIIYYTSCRRFTVWIKPQSQPHLPYSSLHALHIQY